MGCSFLKKIQRAAGKIADAVAPIAAAIPGPWQYPAMVYLARTTIQKGGNLVDVVKVVGTAYFAGEISGAVGSFVFEPALNLGLSGSQAAAVSKVIGNAAVSTLGGADPLKALASGFVGSGVGEFTSSIPGFNELSKNYGGAGEAAQRAIRAGLTSGILGKDVGDAVLNSVVGSVSRAGGDLVKDLTSDLKVAYTDAFSTGSALDENYTKQKQIADTYNSTVDEVEANRQEIKDNFDKYLAAKDNYENPKYLSGSDEGGTYYYKNIYGGMVNVPGSYNEDGTYNPPVSYKADDNVVSGREIIDHDAHYFDQIKYANLVNDAMPVYEKQRADAEAKVAALSTELGGLKESAAPLEKTLTDQKAVLDTQVKEFLSQEEINAQNIAKAVADAAAAKEKIEAATGTTLTQEQLDAIVNTGNVSTAADDFIKTNSPGTTETTAPPTTVTQPTGAAAISDDEIRDFVASHSDEEIKAAMERTGVTQAQVDAAKFYITTGEVPPSVTAEAPVTSTVANTGPSAETIKAFVDTHTPEEVQAAMIQFNVSQAQVDAAMNPVVAPVTPADVSPVVQPVVDTVVAPPVVEPPPVAPTVVEPVVAPPVAPPVVAPIVEPPVVAPPVVAPIIEAPPVAPVVAEPPVVAPPVVQPPAYVPPENLIPVTTTLAAAPPAETVTDLEKVFPTTVQPPAPIAPVGGLNTLTDVAEKPVIAPTIGSSEDVAPGGLNVVSGNLVDTSPGFKLPDFAKTAGSMATKFLQSKFSPTKRPTTAPKPSSVPRPASTPVGGLSAVKAPVKAAAAPRVDVSKLIPVKKAAAPPKTLPSNAKLTPVKSIAKLTSLVKKVG